jgi:hypothetical protein
MYIVRDRPKAKLLLQKALAIRQKKLGENHQKVTRILHDLAVIEDFMVVYLTSFAFPFSTLILSMPSREIIWKQ